MRNNFFSKIPSLLPLKVVAVEWNYPTLKISGNDWNFKAKTSWHLVDDNRLICGCYDDISAEEVKKLVDLNINSITVQSLLLPIDPVFEFSNRLKMKFFTCSSLQSWVFTTPNDERFDSSISLRENNI